LLVRARLVEGDSDTEVMDYVVARYGEYVLLRPNGLGINLVLWLAGPALFFGLPRGVDCRTAAQQTQGVHRTIDRRRRKRN